VLVSVRAQRAFLARAVNYLVTETGIRQFLDIGTGLPASNNTHEVAQQAAPESRIVYVDNDPIVMRHAQVLLTSSPHGATAYLEADLRDTQKILDEAAGTLDFGQPVAVMLLGVLHCIPGQDDPAAIVAGLMAAVPQGSYLVVTHPASDVAVEQAPLAGTESGAYPGRDPHNSGSEARIPTRNPRTIRHYPAHGGTAAKMLFVSLDQPLCR
jgi:hypothetical protein